MNTLIIIEMNNKCMCSDYCSHLAVIHISLFSCAKHDATYFLGRDQGFYTTATTRVAH